MRFSLCNLFLAVTMLGLAFAGMIYRSIVWSDTLISLSLLLYAAVSLRAIAKHGAARAAAIAFSLVGFSYLLIATSAWLPTIRSALLTNYPLAVVAGAQGLANEPPSPFNPPMISNTSTDATATPSSPPTSTLSRPTIRTVIELAFGRSALMPLGRFFLIGHCLFSWLFALVAGWAAAAMYSKRASEVAASN